MISPLPKTFNEGWSLSLCWGNGLPLHSSSPAAPQTSSVCAFSHRRNNILSTAAEFRCEGNVWIQTVRSGEGQRRSPNNSQRVDPTETHITSFDGRQLVALKYEPSVFLLRRNSWQPNDTEEHRHRSVTGCQTRRAIWRRYAAAASQESSSTSWGTYTDSHIEEANLTFGGRTS